MEFHHRVQGSDSIEKLGISIQQLGRRAFPSIVGKEFDRLLKGRFYQALNVKWQRKLGAPKPKETFHELYDRAHMLEQFEKQFAESANTHAKLGKKPKQKTTAIQQTPRDSKKPDKVKEETPTCCWQEMSCM